MSIRSKSRKKPRIDVVPLIDVLMVLIIFFLVTMQFRDLRALNIKLPKIDTAGSNLMSNELIVSISQEGDFFINSKRVDFEKLTQVLKATSLLPQKPVILVVADENVPLRHVTQVVDLCRKNSLEDFRLQAR
jgi:biopolymer transport protein ExbD